MAMNRSLNAGVTTMSSSIPEVYKRIGLGKVYLRARYTTSEGRVRSVSPFTEFTGFTYGFIWEQNNIGHYITSDGKDFKAWTSGTVYWYIVLDVGGVTRLTSQRVDLDMYITVFH